MLVRGWPVVQGNAALGLCLGGRSPELPTLTRGRGRRLGRSVPAHQSPLGPPTTASTGNTGVSLQGHGACLALVDGETASETYRIEVTGFKDQEASTE